MSSNKNDEENSQRLRISSFNHLSKHPRSQIISSGSMLNDYLPGEKVSLAHPSSDSVKLRIDRGSDCVR